MDGLRSAGLIFAGVVAAIAVTVLTLVARGPRAGISRRREPIGA